MVLFCITNTLSAKKRPKTSSHARWHLLCSYLVHASTSSGTHTMHAQEASKLASLLSQTRLTLASEKIVAETLTHKYWTLSKCRGQRWLSTLNQLKSKIETEQRTHSYPRTLSYRWTNFKTVAEEILVSELLTRVFGAIAIAEHGHNQDIVAVIKSVTNEHKKLRKHAESFYGLIPERVGKELKSNLVLLAQSVESSTDFLLGHLSDTSSALGFAFDQNLVAETISGATHPDNVMDKIRIHIGKEMFASASARTNGIAFTPDLNKQIASCLTSCFVKKAQPTGQKDLLTKALSSAT